MDNLKRKVFIDKSSDLGDYNGLREELIEGFLASSPHWEETTEGDEELSIRFLSEDGPEIGPPPNTVCQFRFTVKIVQPGGCITVGKLALHSDFIKTRDIYFILEVDKSAQYSKYLEIWDPDYVGTKSFFKSVLRDKLIDRVTTYNFGKKVGIALADIMNAEPEKEVNE